MINKQKQKQIAVLFYDHKFANDIKGNEEVVMHLLLILQHSIL